MSEQVQLFLDQCAQERAQIEKDLKEIDMMIKQTSSEVDKMVQQNAEITNHLRQIENNIDTVPRADIQNIYTAAQKAQGRLFMMRGQLENLQSRRENLQKYLKLINQALDTMGQLGPASIETAGGPAEFTPAQSMIVRIIDAQEGEKERLSRQMHDGPAQSLTNLILQAEICQRLFKKDPRRAEEELENLKAAVNKTFQTTRSFISDLRPMMLDDLGLVPTLRRYMSTWSDKTHIPAEFSFTGREHRLAGYNEVTIFRAVQEFMNNAAIHANPSRVLVSLNLDNKMAQVVVEDDGIGFDVNAALAAASEQKTIGISTMMERVQMLGGTLKIDSVLGRGTRVTIQISES
ncbi:MAG: sensor histidine kinase [Anaerolineae bacterium]|nr:sensor histidine kinase [Anaerolineae bacterium]